MGVYIKGRLVSVVSYDSDASAFITAANIVDTYQKNAINQLVVNLKAAGIWSKMKAIYPFVGGTAFSHKWNLKDPRDLDAAFRLTFIGGWNHSSTGAKPNGTNAYADTFLVSDTMALNSIHSSFYSRTNFTDNNYKINLGYLRTTPDSFSDIALDWNGVSVFRLNNGGAYTSVSSGGNNQGFYTVSRTASNVIRAFKNGSTILNAADASSVTVNNRSFYIGAGNNNGTAQYFTPNECAFVSLGDGLLDTEALVFNQIVEGYQYALYRNINPVNQNYYNTLYNNETNAFLYSSQITDNTQKTAVNTLVSDLKTAGIWTKMRAVYPFVGGTASTHKWNLINPQDTDAAFRLTFTGGWTHSSTGALPNGTNAYANTFLNPALTLGTNDKHISSYIRTNISGCLIGCNDGLNNRGDVIWRFGSNNYYNLSAPLTTIASTATNGFYLSYRNISTNSKYLINANAIQTITQNSTASTNQILYIGVRNDGGSVFSYSNSQCAFSSIGDGLTDTEAANFYTAVQNFNTTLSRQV
jgi:hypothetical protein